MKRICNRRWRPVRASRPTRKGRRRSPARTSPLSDSDGRRHPGVRCDFVELSLGYAEPSATGSLKSSVARLARAQQLGRRQFGADLEQRAVGDPATHAILALIDGTHHGAFPSSRANAGGRAFDPQVSD